MKADITVILDRSGSMDHLQQETITHFNYFLKEQQRLSGDATLTLIEFDTQYADPQIGPLPVQDFPPLTIETYQPRGGTALLDAVGQAIADIGARLSALSEKDRPERVVVAILTDGEENSSRKFTPKQVKEMITHQQTVYKWDVLFLAAGLRDTYQMTAAAMGIYKGNTASAAASSGGIGSTYTIMTNAVSRSRAGLTTDFTEDEVAAVDTTYEKP
jgi:hypothetical protein